MTGVQRGLMAKCCYAELSVYETACMHCNVLSSPLAVLCLGSTRRANGHCDALMHPVTWYSKYVSIYGPPLQNYTQSVCNAIVII